MRRPRTLALVLAGACAPAAGTVAACTLFDFPRPSDATDAGEGGALAPGYLDLPTAGRFCAQVMRCPGLAFTVSETLALPLDVPTPPLGFSSCMDWVAGPMDPMRVGLAQQQAILMAVANAGDCTSAAAAVPAQLVADGGKPCPNGGADQLSCQDNGTALFCDAQHGTVAVSCSSAYFGPGESCRSVPSDGGAVTGFCFATADSCVVGASCPTTAIRRDCYVDHLYTDYQCNLSGRECATLSAKTAACVMPQATGMPCPGTGNVDDCDQTSVRHCNIVSQTEYRCDAVGLQCSTANDGHVPRCAPPAGAQCNPFDPQQNVCAGSSISVCVGGRAISFDCASIQLGCVTVPSGGAVTSHCGP